jgi:HAE1 family hydrophobic/amphiphilic exporter-1
LYRGIGSVVLGGLMLSTMFTLLLVPAIFSLMMGWKHRRNAAPSEAALGPEIRET